MTITEAIDKARDRVRLVSFGRKQYKMHHYYPGKGTFESSWTQGFFAAQNTVRVARIEEALQLLLGDDDGFVGYDEVEPGRHWESEVRRLYRARKNAAVS